MNLESLLVSRDAEVVRVLRPTLENLQIDVEVSSAVKSGSEALTSTKFDAVIVDCDDLQGGSEILRNLRNTPSNKSSVSFAILNGKTSTQQAFEMGANFVLQKPLTSSTTLRCFNAALSFMVRERRRYFRCPVEAPVVLTMPNGEQRQGMATNLSEGGMAARITNVSLNTHLSKVHFTLPGTKSVMEPKGEIVWVDGRGRAGIRFLEVPDASREQLERWIFRRLETVTQ